MYRGFSTQHLLSTAFSLACEHGRGILRPQALFKMDDAWPTPTQTAPNALPDHPLPPTAPCEFVSKTATEGDPKFHRRSIQRRRQSLHNEATPGQNGEASLFHVVKTIAVGQEAVQERILQDVHVFGHHQATAGNSSRAKQNENFVSCGDDDVAGKEHLAAAEQSAEHRQRELSIGRELAHELQTSIHASAGVARVGL